MAVLADLIARVRLELGDQPNAFTKTFTGDGATTLFSLGYTPIDTAYLTVTVNGTPVLQPAGYTADANHGTALFATAPANLSSIVIQGTYYRFFTDADITGFLNTAITQHTNNRTDSFGSLVTIASIPAVEEYPVAIMAVVEALWALATDSAFDIDITAPDGVHIPRSQRFSQMNALIQSRMEQYQQLCSALNVGIWRVEVGMLRRVSRTTNKLVPLYVPQEIDDNRRPERVYLQNDFLGRSPVPSTVSTLDLQLYQGDTFSQQVTLGVNVTNMVFLAQIRTYPGSPSLYATFTVTVNNAATGLLTLSLTSTQTMYIPVRTFWDLHASSSTDPTYSHTFLRGQVFTATSISAT